MPAILTLSQVQELTSAFDDFTTVADSSLPEYYKEIFPKKCKCGGEMILTKPIEGHQGFTQLQCCNPDCWVKMAHRFAYFTKSLGYKGFGEKSALALYEPLHRTFKYPTFLQIFDTPLERIDAICGYAYAQSFSGMKSDFETQGFQFKNAVTALGIPDLGKGSRLFDIVKSPVVLLDYVLQDRTNELCEIAGIYAPAARYYMKIYRLDIVMLMTSVMKHILNTPNREINVAITGSVSVDGQGLTRKEFIWKCESLLDSNGQQMFKLVETKATSKLDYVIADVPSSSSKYELGKQLNILVTAQEFYDTLKAESEEGKTDG